MSSYGPVVSLRMGDNDAALARAHGALYREAQSASRRWAWDGTAIDVALKASNALVWLYAALQLSNCL